MRFDNLSTMNSEIAFRVIERTGGVFGHSNVSEAAYVNIVDYDDGGELVRDMKLRFACHPDFVSNADRTWRTDEVARVIFSWYECGEPTAFDDDGELVEFDMIPREGTDDDRNDAGIPLSDAEFSHVEIDEADVDAIVEEAVAFAAAGTREVA